MERNRNALRSQRLIREAFISLADARGEGRITVADIVRTADINRSTFYAHYDSLPDLEEKLYDEMLQGLGAWLADELGRPGGVNAFLAEPLPGIRRLGTYIEEIRPVLHALSVRHIPKGESFGMQVRETLLQATGPLEGARLMRFDFIAAALTNVYFTWIVGSYGNMGLDELSETLASYIERCA